MILNFFMAYRLPSHKGGMWVTARTRIIRNYLETWFFLDLVSVVPFDLITRPSMADFERPDLMSQQVAAAEDTAGSGDVGMLRVARVIRLVRLAKLLRVL